MFIILNYRKCTPFDVGPSTDPETDVGPSTDPDTTTDDYGNMAC